ASGSRARRERRGPCGAVGHRGGGGGGAARRKTIPADTVTDLQKRVDQALWARFTPPAVLVNRELRILQFRGQTTPYLEHSSGEATLHLLKMSRGGLGLEIRNLIQRSDRTPPSPQNATVSMPAGSELRQVHIGVDPMDGPGKGDRQFLVVFEPDHKLKEVPPPARGKVSKKEAKSPRIQELEQELSATRHYLQTVIEEQEAVTEELKSANEEIQSSNE